MRPEIFLVGNLANREYVDLVLDGNLTNLSWEMGKHWELAKAIRKDRQRGTTEHPMPIKKQQLRKPELLQSVQQTIAKIVETVTQKTHVA